MNRLFLTLLALIVTFPAFAQTRQNLYDKFCDVVSRRDIAATAALMAEWEKLYPDDAELFSVRANYHFTNAITTITVLCDSVPADNRECYALVDSLGEIKEYMYYETRINRAKIDSTTAILAQGIAKYPDRLDFRLGKVTVHLQANENALAVQEVEAALRRSIVNKNKWYNTLDEPIEIDGISYLRGCIQDYFSKLIDSNDLAAAERMVETCLRYYPREAVFITNKGTLRYFAGDLRAALGLYLAARDIAPADMLIANNIANVYVDMGDKENALKYYHIVAGSNDEYYAEKAMQAIKELNAK